MGNRGCLHDDRGHIKRSYQGKRWIICKLAFKGRHRQIMAPGKYTELFFLDEATALAAGHRPCAECSRPRFNEFVSAWKKANGWTRDQKLPVNDLDTVLHQERIEHKQKKVYLDRVDNLPSGTFIAIEGDGQAYLVFKEALLPWYPEGYGSPASYVKNQMVEVLTPPSVVRALPDFRPIFHPTAAQVREA